MLRPEPTSRFEPWLYGDILGKLSPVLTRTAGDQWLRVLCDLVSDAVRYSLRDGEGEGPEDHSHWWRPAIEDHEQNEPQHPVTDRLVVAVRDAAEALVASDASVLPRIVAAMEAQPFKIFRRIALYLLRRHPEAGWTLVVERLTRREYFDDLTLHHEYFYLARECFGKLDPETQAIMLEWIEKGPDVNRVRANLEERLGRAPTDDEVEERVERWRFEHLLPFRDGLPGPWRRRFQELSGRFQPSEHPDFLFYGSGGVYSGFPSPKSAEELRQLPLPQLIDFLKGWKPSGGLLEASPEGLGQNLAAVVASDPERFAPEAPRFKGLDPTYVRAPVEGLAKAAREGRTFPWLPVLDLCEWVVAQPRDRVRRERGIRDADPDWGWARKAVTRLLGEGLTQGKVEIAIDLRPKVWDILSVLVEDPEPTPDYEAQYGGSNMDPATLSINTVRGDAMHAIVKYGLWVRRHLEALPDAPERFARGFDEMPELRKTLDRHLDPAHDPALAIRAVYGQWFPWLSLLDERWATENVKKIFPMEEVDRPFWDAAWNTYVTFCPPYDSAFRLLDEQYSHAVEVIGTGPAQRVALAEDSEKQLAEHLMALYWRGRIELADPNGLLGRFHGKASAELRAYALEYVGRSLSNTEGKIDAEVLNRLKKLWEWRLAVARESGDIAPFGRELAAFGWWFRSGKLHDRWSVEQLRASLAFAKRTYRDAYLVMERLAEIAPRMPLEAVECASLLVEGDKEGWLIATHRDELGEILTTALRSDDSSARQAATDLVNRLVARGEVGFRDLLSGG